MIAKRFFTSYKVLLHENPLGIPRLSLKKSAGKPNPSFLKRSNNLPLRRKLPGISKIILVSSGKGGVGKSTIAANLSVAISRLPSKNFKVGLLDADVFGPSVPKMFNLKGEPRISESGRIIPKKNFGVSTMSMGYLIPQLEDDSGVTVAWRGMMVTKAVEQLMFEVEWGNLDYLVVDMPPGTGDVQLTIGQNLIVDGAIVVSTPQDVALIDAKKGIAMFEKMKVPVVGIVENMSYHTCLNCGHQDQVFGDDKNLITEAKRLNVEILSKIPLNGRICRFADTGKPIVIGEPDGSSSAIYMELAKKVVDKLE